MSNSIVAGGITLLLLWVFGLWKAAELWSPPFLSQESPATKKTNKQQSIIPKLFWSCQALLLITTLLCMTDAKETLRFIWIPALILGEIGSLVLAIYAENATKAEPRLICLSAQHKLNIQTGYEGALYWTRAFWIFEKPIQIFCSIFLFIVCGLLTFLNSDFRYLTFFGLNLLVLFLVFCKYTTLVVKKDGVTIHRWLEAFQTTKIPSTNIASVQIDKPILHRFFSVQRLTIKSTTGAPSRAALKDPSKAKKYLDEVSTSSV